VILKAKFLSHFLLSPVLDKDSSQGFVLPLIDVRGLREILSHCRVVHDLASRKMSVGDPRNRPSDFTQAAADPVDKWPEFSAKTGMKCELSISLAKTHDDRMWSKPTRAD